MVAIIILPEVLTTNLTSEDFDINLLKCNYLLKNYKKKLTNIS